MKKLLFVCSMLLLGATSSSAQDFERGTFNHLGANVGIGTEGISVGVAAPLTEYLEFGFGVNFMPSIKVDGNVNIGAINTGIPGYTIPPGKVKIKGDFARTTFDYKANVYPFGADLPLFVVAGLSFGGEKMAKLTGHSNEIQAAIATYPQLKDQIYAEIDKYHVKFNDNGDITGDIRVKKVRPYVGLGYGRLVPKKRVGFRVELGCQFMGKMKVYQNDQEVNTSELTKSDDDLSKLVDKLKVYPVLKFVLTTRIL